ncbi:MAG: hypothetical protein WC879_16875 [Melioribacteraceae bacterium]
MNTLKLKYKKDRKVFVPDREVDLPDDYEIEIPESETAYFLDKEILITEIEEKGRKFIPNFKLNENLKNLIARLKKTELSKLSDKELRKIYHENVWKASDEKYNCTR